MPYWDTSCLVKLYAREADSAQFIALVRGGVAVTTSQIGRLELWAAVRRKESTGQVVAGGAQHALRSFDADIATGQITVLALDSAVTAEFEAVIDRCHGLSPPLALRTLDAIHLATSIVSGESQLVATDQRLRQAAIAVGFTVLPP
jgi:predicted nucleic acid-binding protein